MDNPADNNSSDDVEEDEIIEEETPEESTIKVTDKTHDAVRNFDADQFMYIPLKQFPSLPTRKNVSEKGAIQKDAPFLKSGGIKRTQEESGKFFNYEPIKKRSVKEPNNHMVSLSAELQPRQFFTSNGDANFKLKQRLRYGPLMHESSALNPPRKTIFEDFLGGDTTSEHEYHLLYDLNCEICKKRMKSETITMYKSQEFHHTEDKKEAYTDRDLHIFFVTIFFFRLVLCQLYLRQN